MLFFLLLLEGIDAQNNYIGCTKNEILAYLSFEKNQDIPRIMYVPNNNMSIFIVIISYNKANKSTDEYYLNELGLCTLCIGNYPIHYYSILKNHLDSLLFPLRKYDTDIVYLEYSKYKDKCYYWDLLLMGSQVTLIISEKK